MYFTKPEFESKQLLLEGIQRFGLAERVDVSTICDIYYGINVSRSSEPLDQLDVFLLLSRLKKLGLDIGLTVFVAGRYGQLNGQNSKELVAAENTKLAVLATASQVLSVDPSLLRTDDLWYSNKYWEEVRKLSDQKGIISDRKGIPFSDVIASFECELRSRIPTEVIDSLGAMDAPSLYRLFEVAEASYLSKEFSVGIKVGPTSEEEYDVFIRPFMDIIQLRQPLDFRSSSERPRPLTPYIGKPGEERCFLTDTKKDLERKIFALAQRSSGQRLFYDKYMNPFARLSALAVEAAAAADSVPVRFGGSVIADGAGALKVLDKAGTSNLTRIAPIVAECLWAYIVRPIQQSISGGASP